MQLVPITRTPPEWWDLYCTAFPAEERRARDTHEQALRDAHFHACSLWDRDAFIGLLTWWQWDDMLYIEHLAIAESKRGKGYGRAALAALQQRGQRIILEIEPVCNETTARRLAFYRTCGFRTLPHPHIQFAYQQGFADIPLLLLGFSTQGEDWSDEAVARFEAHFAQGPMNYRDACKEGAISPDSPRPLG